MKAIFLKEWRQAHLLPWAALLLSTLVVALYGLWVTLYAQTPRDLTDAGYGCTGLLWASLAVLAMVSTAGMISAETGAGSLSYLLALPISRSRLWWGKALAALSLTGACAVGLFLPASIAIPGVRDGLRDMVFYLPDIGVAVLFILAVTLFCSTLFSRTLTVLLATPVLAFALPVTFGFLVPYFHLDVLRLGNDVADLTLWALLLLPVFLLASWIAFRRGELFESRRHWLVALPVLGIGLAVVVTSLWGIGRWERRYVRALVEQIRAVSLPPGGMTAVVMVQGNSAPISRDREGRWQLQKSWNPRSQHTLLVDLRTGREVVWPEGEASPSLSPDGRRALTVDPLGPDYSNARLRVWEVPSHRCLTDLVRLREKLGRLGFGPSGDPSTPWSPNSKWLFWTMREGRSTSAGEDAEVREKTFLVTMHVAGSNRQELLLRDVAYRPDPRHQGANARRQISPECLSDWAWAPGEDALYLLSEDGALYRYTPADGARSLLWRRAPALPEPGRKIWTSKLSLSPDGRRLALRWVTVLAGKDAPTGADPQSHTVILSVGGGKARLLTEFAEQPLLDKLSLLWSGDSRTLFLDSNRLWHDGLPAPLGFHAPLLLSDRRIQVRTFPFGSGFVVTASWAAQPPFFIDGSGRADLLDRQNKPYFVPNTQTFGLAMPDGIDAQGRLIMHDEPGRLLFALDPQTGARHTIYP